MFCTENERKTCNVEKMGCEGCYYNNDLNNIEKVMFPIKEENLLKDGDKVTEQGIIRKETEQDKIMNEEDIKDLEKYVSFYKKSENFSHDTDWKWNKELGEKIENLINRNKELEEDYISVYLKGVYDERDKWKSKIKEKIEELKKKIKYEDNEKVIIWLHKQIRILQELLEK